MQGQPYMDRGRTLGTVCMLKKRQGATHTHRLSKLGPSNDRIRIISGLQSCFHYSRPPRVARRTHSLYFTYSFVFWHVKLVTVLVVLRHYEHLFPYLFNIACDVVTVLLILIFNTFMTHLQVCTHRHTHTSAIIEFENQAQESDWQARERR